MEKRFTIKWEIDEFAENPLEALRKAILAMPVEANEQTLATVFNVEEIDINSNKVVATHQIDILEDDCNPFNSEDVRKYGMSKEDLDYEKELDEEELQKTMDRCRDENF